jgi:hypothetical protein
MKGPLFRGFVPVNMKCGICGDSMSKGDRQDIMFDKEGVCRRKCEKCLTAERANRP